MPKYLNDNGTEYLVQKIQEEILGHTPPPLEYDVKNCGGINLPANTRTLVGSFAVGSTGLYIFGAIFEITISSANIQAVALIRATTQGSWLARGDCNGGGGLCTVGIAYIDEPETGIDFVAQTTQATTTSSTSKMWYVKLSD